MGRFKEEAPARLPDGWQAHVQSLNKLRPIVGQPAIGLSPVKPPERLPVALHGDA